jgi:hypothetical protein
VLEPERDGWAPVSFYLQMNVFPFCSVGLKI